MKNVFFGLVAALSLVSCNNGQQAKSDSGVTKASVAIQTDNSGHTVEQNNYMKRATRDNEVGSVKHLYIISSYTGDVLEYSTVMGKVTSGGKRLSPGTVNGYTQSSMGITNTVQLGGNSYVTDEVPDEYGMYGSSSTYFYWFDAQDNYHQYYPSGGTFVYISDKPMRVHRANLSISLKDSTDK